VAGATKRGAIATLVAYNIPDRDCGGHSASTEAVAAAGYREWVDGFAAALGAGSAETKAIVIVEPDALAQLDCLDATARSTRVALLKYAVRSFAATGSWVYLDAGHSGWKSASRMASDLEDAGVASAAGFSLNVSNFRSTSEQIAYGQSISAKLPSPAHFVIDTSRNGASVTDGVWCNPSGAGLGLAPSVTTGSELVDAYLWIKTPGLSDGECNGGPAAGTWWTSYAMGLVNNAPDSAETSAP
jgi:endoglucanase